MEQHIGHLMFKGEIVNEQVPSTTIWDDITFTSDIYCGTQLDSSKYLQR